MNNTPTNQSAGKSPVGEYDPDRPVTTRRIHGWLRAHHNTTAEGMGLTPAAVVELAAIANRTFVDYPDVVGDDGKVTVSRADARFAVLGVSCQILTGQDVEATVELMGREWNAARHWAGVLEAAVRQAALLVIDTDQRRTGLRSQKGFALIAGADRAKVNGWLAKVGRTHRKPSKSRKSAGKRRGKPVT